jgi:Uma2 family endonuclease
MKTATKTLDRTSGAGDDQCVVLRNVDWKGYLAILRVRGEKPVPRMVYLDGSLVLVSPSYSHERLKELLGLLIMVLVEELDLPCIAAGSTTFRRRKRRGGVEGDQTYYFTNLDRIRGKKKISLRLDPPPDVAIEVVVSHDADEAVEVYRRFRVPEVWICDQNQLTILGLQPDGRYLPIDRSLSLPMLTASEIHSWVTRTQDANDTAWIKELRRWVADVLAPRYRDATK